MSDEFDIDGAIDELAKSPADAPSTPQTTPQTTPAAQPLPFDMDAAVDGLAKTRAEDDQLNAQFLRYRQQNASMPGDQQAEVFRTAAALRTMGETPDLDYVAKNLDPLKKRVDAHGAKWDQLLADHPGLKDYLLEKPQRTELVSDDLANVDGIAWALKVPGLVFKKAVAEQSYFRRTFLESKGLGSDENRAAIKALEPDVEAGYGADHWYSKMYAGTLNMLPMLARYGFASWAGAQLAVLAAAPAEAGAAGATPEFLGAGAMPVAAGAGAAGAKLATGALTYYETVGPSYQRMVRHGVRPEIAHSLAEAEAVATGAIFAGAMPGMLAKLGIGPKAITSELGAETAKVLEQKALPQILSKAATQWGKNVGHAALMMGAVGAVSQTTDEVAGWLDHGQTPDVKRIAAAVGNSMIAAVRDMSIISAFAPAREAFSNIGESVRLGQEQEQLEEAIKGAEESKLLERSPDEFKALFATLGQSGLKKLYSPIEDFNAYWEARRANPRDVAAKLAGDDGAAYDHAVQTGGDLPMPAENFLAVLGKTEHARGLAQDIKIRPDGNTPRQEQKRVERRTEELAKIPDADIRMEAGRNLVADWFRKNFERGFAGNKRIANAEAVAEKTAKLQADAFHRMAEEINKNANEGTAPITAWDIFREKVRLGITGQKGVLAGDIQPDAYADPATMAMLEQHHASLDQRGRARAYYTDRNTGLLNERGAELAASDSSAPMVARFSTPANKAINDKYGHLSVDGSLRTMAKALAANGVDNGVKRSGDIEAPVRDQAHADALAEAMSKRLDPSGRIKVLATAVPREGSTAETLTRLGGAHDQRKTAEFPARGEPPKGYADNPAELADLAARWAESPTAAANSKLTPAHEAAFAAIDPEKAFFDTYRDPSGLLNELGVHHMLEQLKPAHVVSSDGRAIGKMNAVMGKPKVNIVLDLLSQAFNKAGGSEFNIGRLHGDEYGGGSNDLGRLKAFFGKVREHTDSLILVGTTEDGRFFLQKGIHFDYGIDSSFDRADRIALARAKAERGDVAGPRVFDTEAERDAAVEELDAARSRELEGSSDLRSTNLDKLASGRLQAAAEGQVALASDGSGSLGHLNTLRQPGKNGPRGSMSFEMPRTDGKPRRYRMDLGGADESTAAHESFHMLTEVLHDVATDAGAPQSLKDDYQALIKWMGHASPEERVAATKERITLEREKAKGTITPSGEQRRLALEAKEERAAAGWEQYLLEGKSPSARLADVFSRFGGWLAKIYRGGEPGQQFEASYGEQLGLTPEVKAIFDRLLASESQLDATKNALEMQPLPAAHRGMTPAEQQEYADATEQMQADARTALVKALAGDKRIKSHIVDEERQRLTEERNTELDRTPVYRALSFFQDRELIQVDENTGDVLRVDPPDWLNGDDGKTLRLDRKGIDKALGKDAWKTLPADTTAPKGGKSPSELADFFGFSSGEEFIRALQTSEPRDVVVNRDVQAKLNETFGQALVDNPTALFDEALSAEHNDAAAKRIMLEIRSLRRQLNRDTDPRLETVSEKTRKETARRLIDEKRIDELSPGYYRRAEKSAAKRALEAAVAGKLDKAMGERDTQLLNHYLYRYAREAKEQADHIREQLQKKNTDTYRAGLGKAVYEEKRPDGTVVRHREYLDAHDAIMAAIGIGTQKPQDFKLDDLLARMDLDANEVGFDVGAVRDVLGSGKLYGDLTTPQAAEIDAAIKNIRESANAVREIIVAGERTTVTSWVDRMREDLERRPNLGKAPSDKTQVGVLKKASLKVQAADGGLLDIDTIAEMLGPTAGEFIVNRFIEARGVKNALADRVLPKVLEAFNEMPASMRDRRNEVLSGLDQDLPISDDLNEEGPRSRQWLWMAFLNMGNRGPKSNAERLTKPYSWTEEQMIATFGKYLAAEECGFLQKILDLTDKELWPEVSAKEERKLGLAPEKIKASPIEVTFADGTKGTYAGGYFPAKYKRDVAIGDIAERQDASIQSIYGPNYERASTAKGHTKARAAGYANVLDLNWNVVTNHLAQVIHDVAYDEYIRDTARVVMHPELRDAIFQRFGEKRSAQLNDWLKTVAREHIDSVPESMRGWQEIMNPMRSMMVAGAVGGSIPVMMANLTDAGFAITNGEMSFRHGLPAIAKGFLQAPLMPFGASEMRNKAIELCPEIRHRAAAHARSVRDFELRAIGKNQSKFSRTKERVALMMGSFMEAADAISSTQTFWGAFNDAKAEGLDEQAAITKAGSVIRATLVSHERAQQSAFVRDKIGPGAMSVFYGWYNKRYNGIRRAADRAYVARENEDALGGTVATAKAAGYILATAALAGTVTELMGGRGKQDDESMWQWALRKSIAQFMSLVPWGGMAAPLADLAVTGSFKPPSEMAPPGLTMMHAAITEVGKAIASGDSSDKAALALKAAVGAALVGARLPVRQLARTGGYIVKLVDGDAEDTSPAGVASGLMYGERQNQPANPFRPRGH